MKLNNFGNYNSELGPDPIRPKQAVRVRDDDKIYNWLKTQKGLNLELCSRVSFLETINRLSCNK